MSGGAVQFDSGPPKVLTDRTLELDSMPIREGAIGQRVALLVVGAHRSGTSALTRCMSLRGANLPNNLLVPSLDNPKGFWEPQTIVQLHEEIFSSAGLTWDDPVEFPRDWFRAAPAARFKEALHALISAEYGQAELIVVKDPRLCHLIPLWIDVLSDLAIAPRFIIPVRNPHDVAASLKKRNGIPTEQGLLLWLRHVLAAERDTRGKARSFVLYEDLVADWRSVMMKISADLDVILPRQSHIADAEIDDFLSPQARHHRHEELPTRFLPWIDQLHAWFQNAARGRSGDESILDKIAADMRTAEILFLPVIGHQKLRMQGLTNDLISLQDELGTECIRLNAAIAEKQSLLEGAQQDLQASLNRAGELKQIQERFHAATLEEERTRSRAEHERLQATLEEERTRSRAEHERLQATLEKERTRSRAEHERLRAALEEMQNARAKAAAAQDVMAHRILALESSTSWKITMPLRVSLGSSPLLRRLGRGGLKLMWWTLTLQLSRRLRERRLAVAASGMQAGEDTRCTIEAAQPTTKDIEEVISKNIEEVKDLEELEVVVMAPAAVTEPTLRKLTKEERTRQRRMLGLVQAPRPLSIAVGVVTYNSDTVGLARMLGSARIALDRAGGQGGIFVLDNGGPSVVPEGVERLPSEGNIGFGGGHNRLMTRAFEDGADLYVTANPDGLFHPDCLLNLGRMHVAAGGGALIEAQQFPLEHPKAYDPITFETAWASGACLAIPRVIYDVVDGFDDTFFMYCEDVDLSWRARAHGFRVLINPTALFLHAVTNRPHEPRMFELMLQSGHLLARKWRSATFEDWTTKRILETGGVVPMAEIDLVPEDWREIPDFSKHFSFSTVRW